MRTLIEANLCDGVIYGDNVNLEYVYMPASEIGVKNPIYSKTYSFATILSHRYQLKARQNTNIQKCQWIF